MSTATSAHFQEIIVKALLEPAFRSSLIEAPANTITAAGHKFDAQDIAGLQLIFDDLLRFANRGSVEYLDAKSWAIGICQVKTVSSTPNEP